MILRALLCVVFLCGVGAGITVVRWITGNSSDEKTCQPTQPKPENRLRKFEKHVALTSGAV